MKKKYYRRAYNVDNPFVSKSNKQGKRTLRKVAYLEFPTTIKLDIE